MIHGGYYIKARKIQESDIAFAPPHVREIWDWLIKEVNHKDINSIKRGSTVRTLMDIQDGLKWFVGYRKEVYSKSKCEMAMNWLRKRGMITTMKTTRGMIITVCNYDTYQDPLNYETNNETGTKRTRKKQPSDTINKNGNNGNKEEEKKEINIPTQSDIRAYFKSKGYKRDAADRAFEYYNNLNWHDKYGNPVLNWKNKMVTNWFKEEHRDQTLTTDGKPKLAI